MVIFVAATQSVCRNSRYWPRRVEVNPHKLYLYIVRLTSNFFHCPSLSASCSPNLAMTSAFEKFMRRLGMTGTSSLRSSVSSRTVCTNMALQMTYQITQRRSRRSRPEERSLIEKLAGSVSFKFLLEAQRPCSLFHPVGQALMLVRVHHL